MQGNADPPPLVEDRDVVRFLYQRLGQRDSQNAVAEIQPAATWLNMNDDIAAGQRVLNGGLNEAGGLVTLDDRLSRRHGDDNISEVAPGRLTQAQPPELDIWFQGDDSSFGWFGGLRGGAVHQHVGVLRNQPPRGDEDNRS